MKLYLDDIRPTPDGWIHCRWPQDVIWYMVSYGPWIDEISLDHDLGNDYIGTGYDVLKWIEERVYYNSSFYVPKINLHTDNSVGRQRMQNTIKQIQKLKLR